MSVTTSRFIRKPLYVNAVQVTSENMNDVAEWCDSRILWTKPKPEDGTKPVPYIKVNVHNAISERQTRAFVGDWVLQSGTTYKVYAERAFAATFDPVPVKVG